MYEEFSQRNTVVIAVAQEDTDLKSHAKFLKLFNPEPRFEIGADIDRAETAAYDRTTTYLIEKDGTVRQVFPQLIHYRANWEAILNEMDRLGIE